MKVVWCVFAQSVYNQELIGIYKLKKVAEQVKIIEQENYRASGSYDTIVVERWEVE